ncbi:TRAP-type C4-dicarboxylate transport system substrate-binding protein [Neobacillus niacini]|uniref:TRAP transporter substrate-binding protein n=1 Tax=Neobacillus niacini TaxID=86668 RepID=UPI00285B7299|nr:TRAP transporter substrate-binding protein DctP [Neobacillus niacini]MDR7079768.1 TRAP-type C4-dicarboxylate transport system substrate-binding protein [Neobacillus niacini]
MKIKPIFLSIILLSFVVLLAACGKSSSESSGGDEVYEFDFNIQPPAVHNYAKTVKNWAEYVEKETDGRIKINIYPSAALGPYESVYEDIAGGVYDIGYANPSVQDDTMLFPLSIGELPFSLSDPFDKRKIIEKFNQRFLSDKYDDNVTFLSFTGSDPYHIVSKTPIKSLTDLKGKKINGIGDEKVQLVNLWGGSPVSLSQADLYEALERGTVDSVIYPAIGSIGFSFYEVAPYLTRVSIDSQSWVNLINTESLNRLPADLKKRFLEEFGPLLADMPAEMYVTEQENALKKFESKDGQIIELEESELEKFRAPAKEVWENWVNKANSKGYPGDEMMNYYLELLEAEGIESPYK